MEGQLVPMDKFIRTLSMVMGRPVLNRTNFDGSLDVQLDFTPDDSTAGLIGMGGPGAVHPEADASQPNIFTALQQQLGLKLISTKGPVEVLVIDHVERPSEN